MDMQFQERSFGYENIAGCRKLNGKKEANGDIKVRIKQRYMNGVPIEKEDMKNYILCNETIDRIIAAVNARIDEHNQQQAESVLRQTENDTGVCRKIS